MSQSIYLLTDYKNKFGSKHNDFPYRSGMNKALLSELFLLHGFETKFIPFTEFDLQQHDKTVPILYTSSEDIGYTYKAFIDDFVYLLQENGYTIIPAYKYLKANNNKVVMEGLRVHLFPEDPLKAKYFGSLDDFLNGNFNFDFPCVYKVAEGASGRGVFLVKSKEELIQAIKTTRRTADIKEDIKDFLRAYKHKGYKRESLYRNKFIVQPFIPNLTFDWKVYVFGNKTYIFKRPIQKGRGIKASGGGYHNYLYGKDADVTDELLDFSAHIFKTLDTANCSLDIAFDGQNYYLLEFQCIYFGTAGILNSEGYFSKAGGSWQFVKEKLEIEKVYVDSIVAYLNDKK